MEYTALHSDRQGWCLAVLPSIIPLIVHYPFPHIASDIPIRHYLTYSPVDTIPCSRLYTYTPSMERYALATNNQQRVITDH